jgi:hypothetical protein
MPEFPSVRVAAVTEACNLLPMVRWDRCLIWDLGAQVYGWIDRPDEHADFVLLTFYDNWGWKPQDCSMTTSSSFYSEEMDERLRGTSEGHVHCQRVEEVLPGVANSIHLGRSV